MDEINIFCEKFNTLNEACEGLGERCKGCNNLVYENGILTCKKMEVILGGNNK